MRKINTMSILAMTTLIASTTAWAAHNALDSSAVTGAEQASISATPAAEEGFKTTLGTWAEGTLSTIRDSETVVGTTWLQLDYALPQEWRVGVLGEVAYNYGSPVDVQWTRLRLLAEKNSFVDTASVGNKLTLRAEPRTSHAKFDESGRIVELTSRFDFTFPLEGILSAKLREEPRLQFNTKANAELTHRSFLAYNGIELGPVVAAGAFLFNPNLVNYQVLSNTGALDAGFGINSYIEYGITDSLFVDLWTEYKTPYTAGADLVATTEWTLELYYTF